ncbi:hypothetical protein CcI156_05150 [Frankia sp. CcI156]|jgi:hypothetical protein|uniref:Uncharacterized protein n=1 Tax=Frankia casuarinae (strain DSM 45818 / CECT 9043 / HFP020203 / CcI3) TaxID=106370 RepID=Q2JCR3_FRACC|nr:MULTISPECIES: hypothetical protein [Frankia]ABD10929.1 hypothetical protein Francci3_1553 [Frankia casuarinae]ETA02221.1 hypothetical protein CcI6DRAFT_02396 [Frankia sp. CcI6]EYT92386.1 hypothetical protein ThrDRAFT_01996 [Frankia casuarinae]KDA42903.1 hypothetical protein BMG523Draft_02292 [Frankia sp. BMG5.23]KFB06036.1 hypothetical protein ALLO2DRAFT_01321 [Frankia sp. Allo2]
MLLAEELLLLALAGPARLLEVVAPERASRGHAKERIRTATDLTPVAPIVKKVIAEAEAVVIAAATSVSLGVAASS